MSPELEARRSGFLADWSHDDAEAIYTDETAPTAASRTRTPAMSTVNHSADEWVRGDVHTNTVETAGASSSAVIGAYHQVSVKHLPAYLDESISGSTTGQPVPVPRHAHPAR